MNGRGHILSTWIFYQDVIITIEVMNFERVN